MFLDLDPSIIVFLLCLGFFAAFIDSVVGGGGLIMLPGLLFLGVPPTTALATNKLAGSIGSFTSTIMFLRSGNIEFKKLSKVFPLVVIGSILGAWTVHLINPELLKPLMLCMLALVLVYTLVKKDFGTISAIKHLTKGKMVLFIGALILIGFYDGFLGPGTGSFFIFAFLLVGYDFVRAAGNAKLLNFGSNIGALVLFIILGYVNFTYGLILGAAQIVGSIVGSRFAMKKGTTYVRYLFIIVTVLLLVKNTYDYLK
jgi:uncharacterized protein